MSGLAGTAPLFVALNETLVVARENDSEPPPPPPPLPPHEAHREAR